MKKYIDIGAVITLALAIIAGAIFAGEMKEKINRIEQVQVDLSEIQKENSKLRNEMFEFIMDMWRVEPEQRTKWSKLPKFPTQVSNNKYVGYKFDGFKSLCYYEMFIDTTDADKIERMIAVDTLFVNKDST